MKDIKQGSLWHDLSHSFSMPSVKRTRVRVMVVVEGYVVARHRGCAPFLIHQNDWHARFSPAGRTALKEHEGDGR